MQNNLHCWKHRFTTCSSSNSCTSLVGKNGSVRRSQLEPTWLIIKPLEAASSSALLVHNAAAAQGRLKPDPGAAGEEHTWERTWPCGHHTWQRPPMLTVSWDQFGSEAIIYKFTYIFFPCCPYPGTRRENCSCLGHSNWNQNYCKDRNILRKYG